VAWMVRPHPANSTGRLWFLDQAAQGPLTLTDPGSGITASATSTASGNAGSVTVNAPQITLTTGAEISSTTAGTGAGGSYRQGSEQSFGRGDAVVVHREGSRCAYPILTFWTAEVMGWFLRRTLWQCSEAAPQSGGHPRDELAEARRSAQSPQ
jgi:hypothetical protein